MKDRQPTPGKEGRMLITPEDGSTPFYATVAMADNPIEDGHPLSKETLLKDETAAKFGLPPDTAVPDDVLAYLGKYAQHWWERKAIGSGDVSYVRSTNRNEYPDNGESGDFSYQYLGVPFEKAATAPKISTGSYIGTGTYGKDNPNSLTFDFTPKVIMFVARKGQNDSFPTPLINHSHYGESSLSNNYNWLIYCPIVPSDFETINQTSEDGYGVSIAYSWGSYYYSRRCKLNGNTFSWFNQTIYKHYNSDDELVYEYADSSFNQFNQSGTEYYYIAIC